MTALSDIHQCCAKGFYEIRTTYWFTSLSFDLPSLLVAGTGCHFLLRYSVGQGFPCLASTVDLQVQSLACSFVEISPQFWQHTDRQIQVKRCQGSPSQFGCTNVDHYDNLESGVARSPRYPALCARYEICWCTLARYGPSLDVEWSIWCTGHHSFL